MKLSYTGTKQTYTVPVTSTYDVSALGATG